MPEKQRKQIEFIDEIYNKVVLKKQETDTKPQRNHHNPNEISRSSANEGPATEDKENVFSSINYAHLGKNRGPYREATEVDSGALILSRSSRDDFSPFGQLISEPKQTQYSEASSRKAGMMVMGKYHHQKNNQLLSDLEALSSSHHDSRKHSREESSTSQYYLG